MKHILSDSGFSPDERAALAAALEPDEQPLWAGRPQIPLLRLRDALGPVFAAAIMVWFLRTSLCFALAALAAVLLQSAGILWRRFRLLSSCSLLTNRRALSLRRNVWGRPQLVSWPLRETPDVVVRKDGSGDLLFQVGESQEAGDGLMGIPNIDAVVALTEATDDDAAAAEKEEEEAPPAKSRMSYTKKIAFLGLFAVIGMGALILGVSQLPRAMRISTEYQTIAARVVGGEWHTHHSGGRHGTHTTTSWHPKYTYTVDGKRYEGVLSASADPAEVKEGDTLTVRYDPGHPAESADDSEWTNWLLPLIPMLMGSIFVVAAVFGIRKAVKTSR